MQPIQVVNRLQRELEAVVRNYHVLEHRLEAEGISVSSISNMEPISTNTECALSPEVICLESVLNTGMLSRDYVYSCKGFELLQF